MPSITLRNAATGAASSLTVNEALSRGDTFRLLGRTVTFRAAEVFTHDVAGPMVRGVSTCGRFRTAARVCDTAAA